ncbi:hypothetical protein MRX96_058489 [Rhipicephalus microplus]
MRLTSRGSDLPRLVHTCQGAQPQPARPSLTPHHSTPRNKQTRVSSNKTCLSRRGRAVAGFASSRLRNPLLDQPGLQYVRCSRTVRHNNVHDWHSTDDHDVAKQLSRLVRRPLVRGGAPYRERRLLTLARLFPLCTPLRTRRRSKEGLYGGEERGAPPPGESTQYGRGWAVVEHSALGRPLLADSFSRDKRTERMPRTRYDAPQTDVRGEGKGGVGEKTLVTRKESGVDAAGLSLMRTPQPSCTGGKSSNRGRGRRELRVVRGSSVHGKTPQRRRPRGKGNNATPDEENKRRKEEDAKPEMALAPLTPKERERRSTGAKQSHGPGDKNKKEKRAELKDTQEEKATGAGS